MTYIIIYGEINSEDATPKDASFLRYALEDQIEDSDLGIIIGGGCDLDKAVFDLQIKTKKYEEIKCLISRFLERAKLKEIVQIIYAINKTI